MKKIYLIGLVCLASSAAFCYEFKSSEKKISQNKAQVELSFKLKPGEYLYKESIITSVNNPHIKLSTLQPSVSASSFFDQVSKKQKDGYKDNITFSLTAEKDSAITVKEALIHIHFSINTTQEPQERIIPVHFDKGNERVGAAPVATVVTQPGQAAVTHIPGCDVQQPSFLGSFIKKSNQLGTRKHHPCKRNTYQTIYVYRITCNTFSSGSDLGYSFKLNTLHLSDDSNYRRDSSSERQFIHI